MGWGGLDFSPGMMRYADLMKSAYQDQLSQQRQNVEDMARAQQAAYLYGMPLPRQQLAPTVYPDLQDAQQEFDEGNGQAPQASAQPPAQAPSQASLPSDEGDEEEGGSNLQAQLNQTLPQDVNQGMGGGPLRGQNQGMGMNLNGVHPFLIKQQEDLLRLAARRGYGAGRTPARSDAENEMLKDLGGLSNWQTKDGVIDKYKKKLAAAGLNPKSPEDVADYIHTQLRSAERARLGSSTMDAMANPTGIKQAAKSVPSSTSQALQQKYMQAVDTLTKKIMDQAQQAKKTITPDQAKAIAIQQLSPRGK